ncbi:unnamed protein product [Durusdinium trenchii]|uniref:Endonuclease/exonuclease/phosphatase domain-containing protein n=2 Tax=Durusdinium trenchii TaxID=1381693 RepID=A0ABP0IIP2_9DINO
MACAKSLLSSLWICALCLRMLCEATQEGCPESQGSLWLQKGVVRSSVVAKDTVSNKDDDDEDEDDDEEDLPLFDNSPGQSGNGKPLKSCQGSCSADEDCEGELVCIQPKFVGWDGIVPGCRSDGFHKPLWAFKYCGPTPPEGWRTTTTTTTTPEPTPPPPAAPSVITNCPGVCARLMAFNVYYAQLGKESRMEGIASSIAEMTPDIAVITEQWSEQQQILEKIRQKTYRHYEFCRGGSQEKWWDGDILYRADLFEREEDSVLDWGSNRGLSWAVLRHKASGRRLLIYGAHPVCCGNENIHLQNAVDFSTHAAEKINDYPNAPIVIMGDFNALEDWKSTKLYLGEEVHENGKNYKLKFKFRDAFRDTNSPYVDATTHNSGARLDYIFLERGEERQQPITQGFRTMQSWIWRNAGGGSDHYPILADVELLG